MKRLSRLFLLMVLCAIGFFVSCNFDLLERSVGVEQQPAAVVEGEELQSFVPDCSNGSFYGSIIETSPANEIVWLSPTFKWYYSLPESLDGEYIEKENWDNICKPEKFTLYLSSGPDYTETIAYEVIDPDMVTGSNLYFQWDLNESLAPYTIYRWSVVGYNGDLVIDDLGLQHIHDNEWWPDGVNGDQIGSTFRTGPECEFGNGAETIFLHSVQYDAEISTLGPAFSWSPFLCNPPIFFLNISTSPNFPDPKYYINGYDYGYPLPPSHLYPENYTLVQSTSLDSIQLDDILQDCTRYYWRVQAMFEDDYPIYPSRKYVELFRSASWTFFVNLGSCTNKSGMDIPTQSPVIEQIVTQAPPPEITPSFSCLGLNDVDCKMHDDVCEWEPSKSGGFCKPR